MRTSRISVWLFVVALGTLATKVDPAQAETNLNFVLGAKLLDADDWSVGDSQGSLAFLSTFGPRSWPVQIAIDVLGSGSSEPSFEFSAPGIEVRGEDLVQSTFELDVGVRKIWRNGKARPFVGGGLGVIWGQQETALVFPPPFDTEGFPVFPLPPVVVSESDEAPGVWIDGGIFWRLGKRFNIGIDARYSAAELSFSGRKVDAGGFNLGLILGWGWGDSARIVP